MELTLLQDKAERFQTLHRNPDILVIANTWDVASALLLESAGFPAVATTSAGIGYAYGYPIGEAMPLPEMLETLARISGRLSVPLSADMEAGSPSDSIWRSVMRPQSVQHRKSDS